MAAHCSGCVFTVCVCSLLCVCTLDGLIAEHKFRVWSPYLAVCHITFTFTCKNYFHSDSIIQSFLSYSMDFTRFLTLVTNVFLSPLACAPSCKWLWRLLRIGLFEYILKCNLFLWWQNWIISSHYSSLLCRMSHSNWFECSENIFISINVENN